MKKFMAITLSIILTIGLVPASSIQARSINYDLQTKEITVAGKTFTVDKNLSEEELSLISSDYASRSEPEGVLVSIHKTLTPIEDNNINQTPESNSLLLTIPSATLEVIVFVYRIYEKAGKDNFLFQAYALWHSQPIMHLMDKLALAWSDDFTLYQDKCKLYNDMWPNGEYGYCLRSNVTPEAGISYDCPMQIGAGGYSFSFYSEAFLMSAKVYKDNSTGSANVVSQYAHKTIGLGIGVSFSPTPSISFSGTAIYDLSIPDYAAFDY